MIISLKRLVALKLRRSRRYRPRNNLFVILEHSRAKNPVGDISMGGLSFYYLDKGLKIGKGSYELKLAPSNGPPLSGVTFTTVSDNETGQLIFQKQKIKRHSVRFENLTKDQKTRLKFIINQCSAP